MAMAVNRPGAVEGGFAVAEGGRVLAEIALPVAGLTSLLPFEAIRRALIPLREAARGLGVPLTQPFPQVAFLPFPAIRHLEITDRGLVDLDRSAPIDA